MSALINRSFPLIFMSAAEQQAEAAKLDAAIARNLEELGFG
ncbi:MAG: hypothetical protein KatS3mg052_0933 [Candidatus Roseilinea sp.]|nr:MAG: hypothetical protein KatS3mg052_0933 [Candidatus Roseilinea sp.]